ncbi:hypothetical protein ATCC90586_007793 [Pythium insidiosum]|nr:hypothetical protein ATCC90586_007793 [Pythium insidiosum]
MLLGVDDKKKKRKSSSIDYSMWPEHPSSRPSMSMSMASGGGGAVSALSRNRAVVLLAVVMVFMVFSLSTTSLLHVPPSGSFGRGRSSVADSAVSSPNGNGGQLVAFVDPVATPRHRLRHSPADAAPRQPARPMSFGIVAVADLDKKSKLADSKKPAFHSFLQHGTVKITRRGSSSDREDYSVEWGDVQKFTTSMNEAGRGFELSELAWFDGKLLTFDDRTGIVFRLKHFEGGRPVVAIPEHIVMEGDGLTGKGQKHEWATVKDGELYMGSVGKEFTDNDGNVLSDSNLWVAVMDKQGDVRHEDWAANFARIRKALGCEYPGYVIHEAIEWSAVHRKWFVLPRRVSKLPYNDEADEQRGSNKLVVASEDFSSFEVLDVGHVTPLRGFSSFKFVPRTDDSVIIALKSVEVEAEGMQTSFLTVFDIRGNVLMEETELPGGYKFEGLAFEHDWSA